MWVRLRKLLGLSAAEMAALVEAQVLLGVTQLRVWRRPVGGLVTARPPGEAVAVGEADAAVARAAHLAVSRAAENGLFRPACLVRTLTLQRMLERRGVTGARVCVGVRLRGGRFGAHAWLELGDLVLDDDRREAGTYADIADLHAPGGL